MRTADVSPARRAPIADGHGIAAVREAYAQHGLEGVGALHGRLGVVIVDAETGAILAVRDPMGLGAIYYKASGSGLYVSDSPDAIPGCAPDSVGFMAEFIATGGAPLTTTVWSGVWQVQPGCAICWRAGVVSRRRYWSIESFEQVATGDRRAVAEHYHEHLRRAVIAATEPTGRTWADLSGGLDSSSVVCASARYGHDDNRVIGGTLTYVDSLGGDETRFVDAVVASFGLKNVRIHDPWPWQGDGLPPPSTPYPTRDFPFYARDRATAAQLRAAGADSLLSGVGPDCYMPFNAAHIVDVAATGHVRDAVRQLVEWATICGTSVWRAVASDIAWVVAPSFAQAWRVHRRQPVPKWLRRRFVAQSGFDDHWVARSITQGRAGRLCQLRIGIQLERAAAAIQGWRVLPGIEIRHPLLDRALVEVCLRASNSIRTDLSCSKVLLRAAVRDIVPRAVLARRCTKGSLMAARICWAFRRERHRLVKLLAGSVLADLGCIEPKALLADLDAAAEGRTDDITTLYAAMSLETWLSTQSGRYT